MGVLYYAEWTGLRTHGTSDNREIAELCYKMKSVFRSQNCNRVSWVTEGILYRDRKVSLSSLEC